MVPANKTTCSSSSSSSYSRKRTRVESSAEPNTKAYREKKRRDNLNDRFYELASVLNPSTPPTSDKVAILNNATSRLNQLRLELQHIRQSNDSLLENIMKVKAEKTELRGVKARLKAEKAKMERILSFQHRHVDPAVYKTVTTYSKIETPYDLNYPPAAMWQWVPTVVMDTSQDHALRSPVA